MMKRTSGQAAAIGLFLLAAPAHARPQAKVHARAFHPGEVLAVAVTGQDPGSPPAGRFDGKPLEFFAAPATGTFLALVGLDLDVSTGAHRVELELRGPDGVPHAWGSEIEVRPKRFRTVSLKVAQGYVTPKKEDSNRAQDELARLYAVFGRRGGERLFEGRFVSPIPSAPSARFGERRVFNGVPKAPHSGADLRAKTGTPVLAPAGGRVALAEDMFYQGKCVVLDHGWGVVSYYAHLSEIDVKEGQAVRRGELLGKVGATGRVTGPHLHWAVRVNSARVDPFSLTAINFDRWLIGAGR